MDDKEQMFMNMLNKAYEQEQIKRMQMESNQAQVSNYNLNKDFNIVEVQLELDRELDRIYHLLSGHIIVQNTDGSSTYGMPTDDRLIIFSEYGTKMIMNLLSFYVNKNTLLSYYEIDTIMTKVRNFGTELADLIFTRYEHFFYFPKADDIYQEVIGTISRHSEQFPNLLINNADGTYSIDEDKVYEKCVQWSNEELKDRIRHYPIMVKVLTDFVHSTYMRAFNGEERESLRKFMHISQTTTTNQQPQSNQSGFSLLKPSTWMGAK